MPTETRIRGERVVPERTPEVVEPQRDDALRALAVEEIRRLRGFGLLVVACCLAILIGGAAWALTEYYTAHTAHTWPSSFADATEDEPGVWSTWFFYFAGVWLAVLAFHGVWACYAGPSLRRYVGRPVHTEELERELARLRARPSR